MFKYLSLNMHVMRDMKFISYPFPSKWRIFRLFSSRKTFFCTLSSEEGRLNNNFPELDNEFKKKIFNTKLWKEDPTVSYMGRKILRRQEFSQYLRKLRNEKITPSKSVCVGLLEDTKQHCAVNEQSVSDSFEEEVVLYPYRVRDESTDTLPKQQKLTHKSRAERKRELNTKQMRASTLQTWFSDYEVFNEKLIKNVDSSCIISDGINYGSADETVPVSKIPCGGCGALLHCQNPSIPGYLPKQIFFARSNRELRSLICQRCHFLKEYNIALGVSVSPSEYPRILSQIKEKRGIVILLVDLLDMPCSIWPGISEIIGTKRPVVVVGNKIDLIPGDHPGYLDHISKSVGMYLENLGFRSANIKFISLISAQTGFGVENLITQLHKLWEYKSDVYLIGCTNVGKSTLFNTLIQSDFCKVQAVDIVQRATTSIWPGTTLNLLKFPILRPEGWRLAERYKRLQNAEKNFKKERALLKEQINRRRLYHLPSFYQYVGQTFNPKPHDKDETEQHLMKTFPPGEGEGKSKIGLVENDPDFAKGRWCYDTPGVMHSDQILDLLTTNEIMKVIPRKTIVPRYFVLRPGKSLFLAGLGRLDFLTSTDNTHARFTVFSSEDLPITVSWTSDAEEVYSKLLGSALMAVPCGGPKRLFEWPGLQAKEETIKTVGIHDGIGCADIVLSSAGWILINGTTEVEMCFKVWTPLARGIHLRSPPLLPYAINFKGRRIDHTPTYKDGNTDGKLFTDKNLKSQKLM